MSGRCKSCNAIMSDEDLCRRFPPTSDGKREYSNLCGDCHETAIATMFNTFVETDYKWNNYHFMVDALVGDRE